MALVGWAWIFGTSSPVAITAGLATLGAGAVAFGIREAAVRRGTEMSD